MAPGAGLLRLVRGTGSQHREPGSQAGPKVRCTLDVVGTGVNSAGNPTFDYSSECTFRG